MNESTTIIYMRTVPGKPEHRALSAPLYCPKQDGSSGLVPFDFEWDGSSVPRIARGIFPKHRHPIASCRHDYRCLNAKNPAERKWADKQFEKDVGRTSWWITKKLGYMGVRVGAWFGAGCHYETNNK